VFSAQRQKTLNNFLNRNGSDDEDDDLQFFFPRATYSDIPSSGLVKYRTYDSITERFQASFANIPPWVSTYEFPPSIYDGAGSSPRLNQSPLFRTPRPIRDDLIPFFLSYHRQNIDYGRYFWFCDPHRFIKESLLELTKQSEPLRYAVAAFSALIYSIQLDRRMKRFTFLFYAKAIQELQQVINFDSMDSMASIHTTVATILELASIEVCNHPVHIDVF
jgi:hypothetical protein